jgi:hypothetical protein
MQYVQVVQHSVIDYYCLLFMCVLIALQLKIAERRGDVMT